MNGNSNENARRAGKKSRGGSRPGAGRKPIGITRKISLTLPSERWAEIDRRCAKGDYTISEIIREILDDYLMEVDLM